MGAREGAAPLVRAAGIEPVLLDEEVAHLVVSGNRVVGSRLVPGLSVEAEEARGGVDVTLRVAEGAVIARPVHLCFGVVPKSGSQRIGMDARIGRGASVSLLAHCVFPNAVRVRHAMDALILVGEGASYSYLERHIHGPHGGVRVYPRARVALERGARFRTEFELVHGRVGLIDLDYETTCEARSVMEMTARISGSGGDVIRLSETGRLVGERARGVLTTRVAVRGRARAEVRNTLSASAPYARGHVDCKEVVQEGGTASAVPVVEVSHPKAHVTHEAAIGSVDSKQLETLMTRGLTEEEAVELIIDGLLS